MEGAVKDKTYAMCVTGPHRDAGMRSHSALMTRDSSEQTHDNIGGICNQKFPHSRWRLCAPMGRFGSPCNVSACCARLRTQIAIAVERDVPVPGILHAMMFALFASPF